MPSRRFLPFLAVAALLGACDAVKADRDTLLASTTASAERPRCDACHGFPPHTGAHRFHMDTTAQRAASCHDCHAASIAMTGPVFDSVFTTSSGATVHSQGWPWMPLPDTGLTYQPDYSADLDSVERVAAWRHPGEEFPAWITRPSGSASIPGHANGAVDVAIAASHDASIRVGGVRQTVRATWNPDRMTCSSVKCHDDPAKEYAWKEPTP